MRLRRTGVFVESVITDQHGHHITTRQELHQQVQVQHILRRNKFDINDTWQRQQVMLVCRDLEGVVHLDHPLVVGLDKNISLSSHVCHLRPNSNMHHTSATLEPDRQGGQGRHASGGSVVPALSPACLPFAALSWHISSQCLSSEPN